MSAAEPEGVDWSLPPPPEHAPLAQAAGRRPRYRLIVPGALLVGALLAATWHLYGHQTVAPDPDYLYRAPQSLVELHHPIGLISVVAVFAALGWLLLEYWLRAWRGEWFVILGLLCALGIGTGIGGRIATAGGYGFNFGGAFFVFGSPGIYVATAVAIGVVAYRIARSPAGPCPRFFSTRPGKRTVVMATAMVCCAVPFAFWSIYDRSFGKITQEYGSLILAMAFATVSILGLFLVCFAACAVRRNAFRCSCPTN